MGLQTTSHRLQFSQLYSPKTKLSSWSILDHINNDKLKYDLAIVNSKSIEKVYSWIYSHLR